MRKIAILILLIVGFSGTAQRFSNEIFHEGFLVTSQKDTVKGQLRYDMETNVLTLIYKGKTMTLSSQKVFYFEIFDKLLNNYRQFYSIPFKVNYDYKIPVFFELVYEGKISLLRREALVAQTVNNNSAYWGGGSTSQVVIQYTYYFLDKKGKITHFSGKKKDLLTFMARKQAAVKQFIKDNKLKMDEMADLIRITAFYNSI